VVFEHIPDFGTWAFCGVQVLRTFSMGVYTSIARIPTFSGLVLDMPAMSGDSRFSNQRS
jgi:hypothetical protein